jgi:hypothetical protein
MLIGIGQIGMGYDLALDPATNVYLHARDFSLHPAFDLVACVDPSSESRPLFQRTYGRPIRTWRQRGSSHQADVATIAGLTIVHADISVSSDDSVKPPREIILRYSVLLHADTL